VPGTAIPAHRLPSDSGVVVGEDAVPLRVTLPENNSVADTLVAGFASAGDDGDDSIRSAVAGAGGATTAQPEFIPGDPLSDPSCETFHAMSGIFEGYEREYCELSAQVTCKTGALTGLAAAEKPPKVQELEADMAEAEALVRRMDLEARSLPVTVKTPLLAKLKEYKQDLATLKREAKAASASGEDDNMREELLSRSELGQAYSSSSGVQREQLLSATERVRATGDRIKQGKQTLLETEELGVSILQDLHKQRETIVHARDNLHEADDNLGRARRVLSVMSRRAMTNKLILVAICMLLMASIGVVIYFKLGAN